MSKMQVKRWLALFGVVMLLVMLAPAAPAAAQGSRFYPQTGHWVSGGFLSFYDRWGGPAAFGYPLTEEYLEGGTTMQFFEKARFEWHPWNPDPFKVELSLLGVTVHGPADPPAPALPWRWDRRYFSETGHNVWGAFLTAYNTRGGLTLFGYPITEAFPVENGIWIQYFQRARMEIYPGDSRVYLGNLGWEVLHGQFKWPGTVPQPAPVRSRYFPETGQTVQGAFLDFWEGRGGLDIFGYPISGEFQQNGVTVQYFQRARMEWRPSNPPAFRVQLGLLGSEVHGPAEPAVPNWVTPWNPNARYFAATGHVVTGAFLNFFDTRGGLDIFGYPISEAQLDGGMTVQWFQRARMEWHPENPAPWRVQLTLLGSIVYGGGGATPPPARWEPRDGFGKVWRDNPGVRDALGYATEEQRSSWCAEEHMQGGILFYRQDIKRIYALRADGTWRSYADTWDESMPSSWGYHPPAGLYEPVRGFGKLWREQLSGPSGPFGWGTDQERGFTGLAQTFERGLMLENEQRQIYVLYGNGTWQQYPDLH